MAGGKGQFGFIGVGNMATAIIEGMLKNGYETSDILIYDIDADKTLKLSQKGVKSFKTANELVDNSDYIFLCVKPQNFEDLFEEIKKTGSKNKVYISIAAGITTSYIQNKLDICAKVIRLMPNTPLLISEGATAICKTENVSDEEYFIVKNIFSSLGLVEEIPENLMNAVVSVNASSPAYVYYISREIIKGAVEQGIDEETAKKLFCQTLIGSAKMIMQSDKSINDLINMVTSKGGTTFKALEVFDNYNLNEIIISAMKACTKRAEELSK